jgi:hypothetical protein
MNQWCNLHSRERPCEACVAERPKAPVIELMGFKPKRDPDVWTHDPDSCGGQQFYLLESGCAQCVKCRHILKNLAWRVDQ